MSEKAPTHKYADPDGQFRRKPSQFRHTISSSPSSPFPPEKDRYALYLNIGCPWAHRANLVRSLKGLDAIVQLIVCDFELTNNGWLFTGRHGSDPRDPLTVSIGPQARKIGEEDYFVASEYIRVYLQVIYTGFRPVISSKPEDNYGFKARNSR